MPKIVIHVMGEQIIDSVVVSSKVEFTGPDGFVALSDLGNLFHNVKM